MPKKLYERGPASRPSGYAEQQESFAERFQARDVPAPKPHPRGLTPGKGGSRTDPKYAAQAHQTWKKMRKKFGGKGTGGPEDRMDMSDPDAPASDFEWGGG